MRILTVQDHNRTVAGYTYVYPVVSRRAGGVSIGINLNPNNACNWACIYCQVPNLTRGNAPVIDLKRLENELHDFLVMVTTSDWLEQNVPEGARVLQDIAFSGNGEPTSAREFGRVVEIVGRVLKSCDLLGEIKVRLITNGSLMNRKTVQDAVSALATINGEVWFKIDRATVGGMATVNQVEGNLAGIKRRLRACAARCPTWVQTCWFALDGKVPTDEELVAYLALVDEVKAEIAGVHLYGIVRQSMQPEAGRLSAMSEAELQAVGEKIRQLGVTVTVSP
jgi:wyosine [tRNA(Phe)-imidazoG37] synthetase (radical SAM superfamily)